MIRPVRLLHAVVFLTIFSALWSSCERSEYTNRFTTPVASIGNNWIELTGERAFYPCDLRSSENAVGNNTGFPQKFRY